MLAAGLGTPAMSAGHDAQQAALIHSGWGQSADRQINARIAFSGWGGAQVTRDAAIVFRGWGDESDPQTGRLSFSGWGDEGSDTSAAMVFSGWGSEATPRSGDLAFSGWGDEAAPHSGDLTFAGFGGADRTYDAAMIHSGWAIGRRDFGGGIAFAGCARDETIAPRAPLPASTVQAHYASTDTDPNMHLEGNWIVEWEDSNLESAHVTLTKGGGWSMVRHETGTWGEFTRDPAAPWTIAMFVPGLTTYGTEATILPNGQFMAEYYYGVHGHWGGSSVGRATGEAITGEWNYGDNSGREVWRRVRPTLTGILGEDGVVSPLGTPVRVTSQYAGPVASARGNRPGATLTVLGRDLWGRQRHWIPEESNIEFHRMSYLCADWQDTDTVYSDGFACLDKGGAVGLRFDFTIWWDARPGRHYLYLNDVAIPFDLVIEGYPECGT